MWLIMNMVKFKKGEVKMTIDGHYKGSERSHNKGKNGSKENGIRRRMSQEEIDREMVELKAQINNIRELLQNKIEENHRQGGNVKKKSK
jgi:hypothetical protein